MNTKHVRTFLHFIIAAGFFVCGSANVYAQKKAIKKEIDVIESSIDFNDLVPDEKGTPAEEGSEGTEDLENVTLSDEEIIILNQTLKKVIEENQSLQKDKSELDRELRWIRGQRAIELNRVNEMNEDMQMIRNKSEQIVEQNKEFAQNIVKMRSRLESREKEHELKIKEITEKLQEQPAVPQHAVSMAKAEPVKAAAQAAEKKERLKKADLLSLIQKFNMENDKLKTDSARVHYNLGNTHFHKGEYQQAANEYRKAVQIVPTDASAHFNLALVSGEYLKDFGAALKHYREYVYLNPKAEDIHLVKGKILQAKLELRTQINSPTEAIYKKAILESTK